VSDVLLITGTDTGVGKTVVTAAIAASALAAEYSVAVIKPAEAGVASAGESDVDTVARLAGPVTVRTLASYPDPLAPLTAARQSGLPELAIGDVIEAVTVASAGHELVLVEGSGGLLVQMGEGGWTVADLATALRAPVVVVARAGLGTLNHTALTFEALSHRGLTGALVIGCWPAEPELVHWTNLTDFNMDLAGVLPAGVGSLAPEVFREGAPRWLTPKLFGQANPDVLLSDAIQLPPHPLP
jgi:dethiobiotin synthetase